MLLASPPLDFHVTDSWLRGCTLSLRTVRHVIDATFASFLVPKVNRPKLLDERLGKLYFVDVHQFHTTFLVQH